MENQLLNFADMDLDNAWQDHLILRLEVDRQYWSKMSNGRISLASSEQSMIDQKKLIEEVANALKEFSKKKITGSKLTFKTSWSLVKVEEGAFCPTKELIVSGIGLTQAKVDTMKAFSSLFLSGLYPAVPKRPLTSALPKWGIALADHKATLFSQRHAKKLHTALTYATEENESSEPLGEMQQRHRHEEPAPPILLLCTSKVWGLSKRTAEVEIYVHDERVKGKSAQVAINVERDFDVLHKALGTNNDYQITYECGANRLGEKPTLAFVSIEAGDLISQAQRSVV